MFTLSHLGRIALSFTFVLTLISSAFATIQHRILIYLVAAVAILALTAESIAEFAPSHSFSAPEMILKLSCLSIMLFMTLKRTLRPGPVTLYRAIGGIAGYLLIGFAWTFAYQLVVQQVPQCDSLRIRVG
jgi:hypothetical protein